MTKLEKVIKGLESHRNRNVCVADEGEVCPYFSYDDCSQRLAEDALKLLKERQWVSVKDRLPEHGKRYLIYATSGDGKEHHITIAAYGGHFALSGRCAYWKVTHWMPLPEPPKEGGGE